MVCFGNPSLLLVLCWGRLCLDSFRDRSEIVVLNLCHCFVFSPDGFLWALAASHSQLGGNSVCPSALALNHGSALGQCIQDNRTVFLTLSPSVSLHSQPAASSSIFPKKDDRFLAGITRRNVALVCPQWAGLAVCRCCLWASSLGLSENVLHSARIFLHWIRPKTLKQLPHLWISHANMYRVSLPGVLFVVGWSFCFSWICLECPPTWESVFRCQHTCCHAGPWSYYPSPLMSWPLSLQSLLTCGENFLLFASQAKTED